MKVESSACAELSGAILLLGCSFAEEVVVSLRFDLVPVDSDTVLLGNLLELSGEILELFLVLRDELLDLLLVLLDEGFDLGLSFFELLKEFLAVLFEPVPDLLRLDLLPVNSDAILLGDLVEVSFEVLESFLVLSDELLDLLHVLLHEGFDLGPSGGELLLKSLTVLLEPVPDLLGGEGLQVNLFDVLELEI